MCRPPAAWPAGGAALRRRGPLAAPPGGGSPQDRSLQRHGTLEETGPRPGPGALGPRPDSISS